jgi:flagellar basal-body rod modification protein FlgD
MSSIWTHAASQAGISPFNAGASSPRPGGLRAAGPQQAAPATTGPGSTTGSADTNLDSTSGLITANDFLSLLVTEMQNQDPTADTDPNEYISQLVQINSLEQLISINQNLVEVLGTATNPASPTATQPAQPARHAPRPAAPPPQTSPAQSTAATQSAAGKTRSGASASRPSGTAAVTGNLSVPRASPASRQVAHALDGRVRSPAYGHGIRDIPTRP